MHAYILNIKKKTNFINKYHMFLDIRYSHSINVRITIVVAVVVVVIVVVEVVI